MIDDYKTIDGCASKSLKVLLTSLSRSNLINSSCRCENAQTIPEKSFEKYEAVCERVEQNPSVLAQLKNVHSLKFSGLGFLRALMTVSILILVVEPPLAPDDVTSKTEHRNSTKTVFDVTSSEANGGSTTKMNMPTVISTLKNPKSESFREWTFLSCANPCSTLPQTASYTVLVVSPGNADRPGRSRMVPR
ncbi:hypothetical protein PRIPAC_79440, partial [Pristionchus pacificus]|uniref:Uncharacterized protein n=1 Tax=Pristionchus pacificus TaxID=54126 RepID=A0A2A6CNG6_PRIPA